MQESPENEHSTSLKRDLRDPVLNSLSGVQRILMNSTERSILTINSGSSSIKFSIYRMGSAAERVVRGSLERIGLESGHFRVQDSAGRVLAEAQREMPDHETALEQLFEWLNSNGAARSLTAIGHRIVHGGPEYSEPQRITQRVIERLQELISFAPEHLPHQVKAIEIATRRHPDLPQVACFDTAFHHGMPAVSRYFPLPRALRAEGLVRYGFHGLSYSYILGELAREAGGAAATGRIVIAHLGNGCSMAAVKNGKSVDTTMGFTPTGGLVMGTRSGDLDPGLVLHLLEARGIDTAALRHLLNRESGLIGVSQISSDMQDLLRHEAANAQAAEAIALFCYQAKKFLAAMAAALGGLDTLVFTAGIGENAPSIRERICEGLEFFGIRVDRERNRGGEAVISAAGSPVTVRVMRTDEEIMLARLTNAVLNQAK